MSDSAGFRIVSLDGIRAVAAMIVFISHNGLEDLVPGGFGVSIFFFLSGYLITTLLRIEFEQSGTIHLGNFYLRRVFRIFPPFYIVLLLYAVPPIGHLGAATTGLAITGQFLQLTNYIMAFGEQRLIPMTGPMWSLSVEEHFYLLFPLGFLWLLGRFPYQKIARILLLVCGVVLLWRCVLVYGFHMPAVYTYVATDARLDALLFGCIMAIGFNPALDREAAQFGARTWAVALAVGCMVLLFTLAYRNPFFRSTFRYTLQGLAFFPVFFCAIRYQQWPVFRWLEHPWVRGLGIISYTFYLVHERCLQAVSHNITQQPIVKALLGFGLAVGISTAMYYLVERRFARLRKRLHEAAAAAKAPVPVANA
jgi:peptidoglycan/LPS O-acetylase OafA/YrhL